MKKTSYQHHPFFACNPGPFVTSHTLPDLCLPRCPRCSFRLFGEKTDPRKTLGAFGMVKFIQTWHNYLTRSSWYSINLICALLLMIWTWGGLISKIITGRTMPSPQQVLPRQAALRPARPSHALQKGPRAQSSNWIISPRDTKSLKSPQPVWILYQKCEPIGWSNTSYKNRHICQHEISKPLWVAAWACKTSTSETLCFSVPKLMDRKSSFATHQIHKYFLSVGSWSVYQKKKNWKFTSDPKSHKHQHHGLGFPLAAADVHTTTLLSFQEIYRRSIWPQWRHPCSLQSTTRCSR